MFVIEAEVTELALGLATKFLHCSWSAWQTLLRPKLGCNVPFRAICAIFLTFKRCILAYWAFSTKTAAFLLLESSWLALRTRGLAWQMLLLAWPTRLTNVSEACTVLERNRITAHATPITRFCLCPACDKVH
jgi:hypothetical protein